MNNPYLTNEYYQIRAIIKSSKFKKIYKDFKDSLGKWNLTIPTEFKNEPEFWRWNEMVFVESNRTIRVNDWLRAILSEFNMPIKKHLTRGLSDVIFLKIDRTINSKSLGTVKESFDEDSNLHISLENIEHLTQAEFLSISQNVIKPFKKRNYIKQKNNDWELFDRDFEIYTTVEKIKSNGSKSIYSDFINSAEGKRIISEYGNLEEDTFNHALKKARLHFSPINFNES